MVAKKRQRGAGPSNRKNVERKANPFELRWERRRHNALSRTKQSKANRVNVGAARLASNTKRRSLITADMKSRSKRNKFTDKRIGEYDPEMTEEDRYLARFQKERARRVTRKSVYNLGVNPEDEQLTHEGQPLGYSILRDDYDDVEDLNEKENDTEEEEDAPRGGFIQKETLEDDSEADLDAPRTHKEIMEEVILKSKFHKLERQREKAADVKETEDLDAQLPELLKLMHAEAQEGLQKKVDDKRNTSNMNSSDLDYNRLCVELAKDARAHTSERLRTKEEVAQEERERLEKLEKTRLKRMEGSDDDDDQSEENHVATASKFHRSGDDIGDDFQDVGLTASGSDRSISSEDDEASDENKPRESARQDTLLEEASDTSSSEDSDEEGRPGDEKVGKESIGKSDTKSLDNLEDSPSASCVHRSHAAPEVATVADDALPFVYKSCPKSLAQLESLFTSLTPAQRSIVVDRLRRCFAVALDPTKNKALLCGLLSALLERIDAVTPLVATGASEIACLLPHVHALSAVSPDITLQWARDHVLNAYEKLVSAMENSTPFSSTWDLAVLQRLRAVSKLYPGSDHRHCVTTPLCILLSAALSHGNIETDGDRATGVFISFILVELLSQAQRHSGELLDFLNDITMHLVDQAQAQNDSRSSDGDGKPLELADCAIGDDISDEDSRALQGRLLKAVMEIVRAAAFNGKAKELRTVFAPILKSLKMLSRADAKSLVSDLESWIADEESSRTPLKLYTKKKADSALKTINVKYEAVDGVYLGKRKNRGPTAELQRLRQRVKKEARSTTRELRRDAAVRQAEVERSRREEDERASRKAREENAWLEEQQRTWNEQTKKVKKMTGKRW